MLLFCTVCADDADLADDPSSRSWEQQRQKIKAVEDKYRWKLNEHGVCIFHYVAMPSNKHEPCYVLK